LDISKSGINLFIEDITYINDMNVALTVKRGPINELLYLSGLNRTSWPETGPPMKSTTIFYFINLQTYEVRRDIMWTIKFSELSDTKYSLLCSTDSMLPKLGAYMALTTEFTIKVILLVVNSYILNLFGILEGIISKDSICNGRKLNHHALDNCNYHPLSMSPLGDVWVRMDRSFDSLVFSTLQYFGVLFGFEFESRNWMKNFIVVMRGPDSEFSQGIIRGVSRGVAAGASAFISVMFNSVYTFFFVIDEVIIKYILQQIHNKYEGIQRSEFYFFSFSNLIFDSIASGSMKKSVLGSQYKICHEYAEITGDPSSPLGKTVFHTCVSIFEMVYALMKAISSIITLSALTDCVCDIDPLSLRDDIDLFTANCEYKLPTELRLELYAFLQGRNQRSGYCSTLIN